MSEKIHLFKQNGFFFYRNSESGQIYKKIGLDRVCCYADCENYITLDSKIKKTDIITHPVLDGLKISLGCGIEINQEFLDNINQSYDTAQRNLLSMTENDNLSLLEKENDSGETYISVDGILGLVLGTEPVCLDHYHSLVDYINARFQEKFPEREFKDFVEKIPDDEPVLITCYNRSDIDLMIKCVVTFSVAHKTFE